MSVFLKWLAALVASLFSSKETPVTNTLTTVVTDVTTTVSKISSGATALGGEIAAFWSALKDAWDAKGTNIPFDAAAVDDIVILAAQIATDVGTPGAGTVLMIAKLLGGAIPESATLINFFVAIAKQNGLSVHGAIPGASPEDGGYPNSAAGHPPGR